MADQKDDRTIDEKVVFGIATDDKGILTITIGIPDAAYEYTKSNDKTDIFDFLKIGIPVRLIIFPAKDHAAAIKVLEEHNKKQGKGLTLKLVYANIGDVPFQTIEYCNDPTDMFFATVLSAPCHNKENENV